MSNIMLVGATGSGKTYSLGTLISAGITPLIIATEPGIEAVLSRYTCDQLHWKYIAPANPEWKDMIDSAKKINTLSFKSLAEQSDINKRKYTQFIDVLTTCNEFVCDRCGENFGDVGTWNKDRALCVDSLSGLNIMAMNLVVGSKPTKSMADWGMAMDNLERLIIKLTTSLSCHFILTAHLEREQDEITGGIQLMASTLGRKLAPRIPRFFDEVVMCKRDGDEFSWSTAARNVDLKARNLIISEKLPPSFQFLED
jgi:hypothetical protein